jgi:hypothetical protein
MDNIAKSSQLGCRLEQRSLSFSYMNTSGSQSTSPQCQNWNVCSGEVIAVHTDTKMETLVLEMSDKVICTTNVKPNKGFDKNKGR